MRDSSTRIQRRSRGAGGAPALSPLRLHLGAVGGVLAEQLPDLDGVDRGRIVDIVVQLEVDAARLPVEPGSTLRVVRILLALDAAVRLRVG